MINDESTSINVSIVSLDTLKRWAAKRHDKLVPDSSGTWQAFLGTIDDEKAVATLEGLRNLVKSYNAENPLLKHAMYLQNRWVFGINETMHHLLETSIEHPFICFTGMGGLGKTTQAEAFLFQANRQGYISQTDVIHIIAKHLTDISNDEDTGTIDLDEMLQDLIIALNINSNLVGESSSVRISQIVNTMKHQGKRLYLDNLHSRGDYRIIKPLIDKLVSHTQVMIAMRSAPDKHRLQKIISLGELSHYDSLCLLLYEGAYADPQDKCDWMSSANVYEFTQYIQSDDFSLDEMCHHPDPSYQYLARAVQLVGGNPFALLLILGLYKNEPPVMVLQDFDSANYLTEGTRQMYTRVFRKVWQRLSDKEKALLHILSEAPIDGLQHNRIMLYMKKANKIEEAETRHTIHKLKQKNLLQIKTDDFSNYVYYIHQLTHTFVRSDISGLAE
ncbi:MAG: hypothetical protein AAF846_23525 [Chloroflexota bacterium]